MAWCPSRRKKDQRCSPAGPTNTQRPAACPTAACPEAGAPDASGSASGGRGPARAHGGARPAFLRRLLDVPLPPRLPPCPTPSPPPARHLSRPSMNPGSAIPTISARAGPALVSERESPAPSLLPPPPCVSSADSSVPLPARVSRDRPRNASLQMQSNHDPPTPAHCTYAKHPVPVAA